MPAAPLPPIAANDNRLPGGELRNGVLTLSLEMRRGDWHPERENGETIPVYAFGETGKALQVPAPAIRVPQGTAIDVTVHNALPVAATLHGFHERPGTDASVIELPAGETRHIRFSAGVPGTYLYWARTPDGRRGTNRVVDALLGGALVVDPAGAAPADDRIFVLERWNGPTRTAINGKSWPYTERLDYAVGQRVRWRVVNASDLSHPMHLHGFHFSLDGEGDGERWNSYAAGAEPQEFTHSVAVAQTFDMTWTPTEPGRWLYHCHRMPHMRLPVPLDPADASVIEVHDHAQMHDMNSGYAGMGGMIMGITVTGKSAIDTQTNWAPKKRLELSIGSRAGDARFYELSVRDLNSPVKAVAGPGLDGPPIVITQGEPAEIAIVNHLKEPTSIHWHGMELESYYDGVPGYGGRDEKRSPAVEPGQTFSVRIAPPRAGTFIYHTHWHDDAQLTGGVHGALIVMPPGETYNPAVDKSFLFSLSPAEPFGAGLVLMNGIPQPSTMHLKTGVAYRFRLINITPTMDNLRVSLRGANGEPVQWRLLAKDASEVRGTPVRAADQPVAVGETFDFEYRAAAPGELSLTGLNPGDNRRAVQTLIFADR